MVITQDSALGFGHITSPDSVIFFWSSWLASLFLCLSVCLQVYFSFFCLSPCPDDLFWLYVCLLIDTLLYDHVDEIDYTFILSSYLYRADNKAGLHYPHWNIKIGKVTWYIGMSGTWRSGNPSSNPGRRRKYFIFIFFFSFEFFLLIDWFEMVY